jgi:tetratricopeptide (TPR) repeat protein
VPVWHEKLKQLRADNKVVLVGVIQEQHADRCRLFAQWQQFDWPILQDSVNLLRATAVPLVIALDEHGVVQSTRMSPDKVEEFLAKDFPPPTETTAIAELPDLDALRAATDSGTGESWQALGDALTVWHSERRISEAISAYREALTVDSQNAPAAFGLGVAYRRRHEAPRGLPTDFQNAVDAWTTALDINPNQYIYRRRIEQYGPRLSKPYPFYDWVETARIELGKRGETPHPLSVEPSGAEIATPSRKFAVESEAPENPDPLGRINRDRDRIRISSVAVPSRIQAGDSTRMHISLVPRRGNHWNNEAQPVRVWIDAPEGWEIERRLTTLDQPKEPESTEVRRLEFELKTPKSSKDAGPVTVNGYALYFVCDDANGSCFFLRGDFKFVLNVK